MIARSDFVTVSLGFFRIVCGNMVGRLLNAVIDGEKGIGFVNCCFRCGKEAVVSNLVRGGYLCSKCKRWLGKYNYNARA